MHLLCALCVFLCALCVKPWPTVSYRITEESNQGLIMISGKHFITALIAGSLVSALVFAQQAGAPGATGATATGRGGRGGRAGRGAAGASGADTAAGRGVVRARAGGFPEHTRELASPDVLIRGKSLYESTCASCHANDIRGVIGKGISLLRSQPLRSDQHGEIVAALVAKHDPKINLVDADNVAVSEYLHSILNTTGPQGSPPGRNPVGIELNVLVGDAKAGQAYFSRACASCHSVTGDLQGIASKYADPKALQNGWVPGTMPLGGGGGRGGGGRGGGRGGQATVTMPDGTKLEGRVVRKDDYIVILTLADGTRKSIPLDIDGPVPTVVVSDPTEAHKKMAIAMDDPDNKNMHDITAYLWTLK
jgi:cytochrome c oxidase cbb3-type subunit 3